MCRRWWPSASRVRASSPSPPPASIPSSARAGNGAREDVPPTAPSGEYANSCVARERMFQHFSHQHGTPGRLMRLSYAIDMRYGVLHDVAQKVLRARADRPGDGPRQHHLAGRGQRLGAALAGALRHADLAAQPERAEDQHPRSGAGAGRSAWASSRCFTGQEAPTPPGWSTAAQAFELFGPPQVSAGPHAGLDRRLGAAAAAPAWASRRTTKRATASTEAPCTGPTFPPIRWPCCARGAVIPAHLLALDAEPPARRAAPARDDALLPRRRRRRPGGGRALDAVRDPRRRPVPAGARTGDADGARLGAAGRHSARCS